MTGSYFELVLAACILILPFLYESSQAFRYHLKFLVYYGGVMFISVLLMPVFCCRPRNVANLLLASYFCKHVSTIIGLKWTIRGEEHLAEDRCCIIVSNHQSSIDILGMFEMWPTMGKCSAIAKKDIFYAWPFGLAAWLGGLVFIPRKRLDKAKNVMNDCIKDLEQKKTKLWIFPEGTRRNTGQVHPFKKGAFHLAISSQLPILPVVYSRYYFLDKKTKRFDPGKICVTVLPAVETKGMKIEEMDSLMEKIRRDMSRTFSEVSKEVLSETLPPISSQKVH